MKKNKQSFLLITVLITVVLIVEGITLLMLYNTAFEQQRSQLTATAQNQAKLIEAVARFDSRFNNHDHDGGAVGAILRQIRDARLEKKSFGKSGEFLFGKIENEKIHFLLPYRFKVAEKDKEQRHWLKLGGSYAEPMQLALAGKSGTIIARDYRGVNVLAAYEQVNVLNYGLVVKVDISEIREPYFYVGIISLIIAFLLISIGAIIFLRITNPIVENLEVSESRLNEAQRLAKVGSWELDLLKGNLTWSDEIFHMFEIDKNKFEATYEAFLNAIHPEDRDKVNQAYSDSLSNRQAYEISHRLQMSDGTIKYVHETCESFFDDEHKPVRSVGTVQDITEIKLAEIKLETYQAQLEVLVEERTKELKNAQGELVRKERLATLGQLTATVSHELRNPLGAMRPSLYIIEKKCDQDDERVKNAIQRLDRNIDRCDRIIDELLDFTRITELDFQPTEIEPWLTSVIFEQEIPEGITVKKEFSSGGVILNIDEERLRRAIINVFENGCHSMMDDNQQLVSTERAQINIETHINDKRVEIIVRDVGLGMSHEVLDKIYEPLFSTKGFGVGLGMPTVKQIMEQHNGGVEISSDENKGTSVLLWLPLKNLTNS